MVDLTNLQVNAAEFLPGRLYFVVLNTDICPKSITHAHYFAIDTEQCYYGFYEDFGPLNLSILYHYCVNLDRKLTNIALKNKKIVHYVGLDEKNRVNSAFLIGSYAVIKLGYRPEQAYKLLTDGCTVNYCDFRDASLGEPYRLSLLDCLKAIRLARDYGFFNFDNFDYLEYEHYEKVENGDLNWIVPEKFLAFCGPHQSASVRRGHPLHAPNTYFSYFRRHNVTTIVRLNSKTYDAELFTDAGFNHEHLFFVDGGTPGDRLVERFLRIAETYAGAVAIHCKAGLGRTGTLIACYIMKHFCFTAEEAIAWVRICRPGSIIARQQTWLKGQQAKLWEAGKLYRFINGKAAPMPYHYGIYSVQKESHVASNAATFSADYNLLEQATIADDIVDNNNEDSINDEHNYSSSSSITNSTIATTTTTAPNNSNLIGIMRKVDLIDINGCGSSINLDLDVSPSCLTQGDHLNRIKAQRVHRSPIHLQKGVRNKAISKYRFDSAAISVICCTSTAGIHNDTNKQQKNHERYGNSGQRRCSHRLSAAAVTVTAIPIATNPLSSSIINTTNDKVQHFNNTAGKKKKTKKNHNREQTTPPRWSSATSSMQLPNLRNVELIKLDTASVKRNGKRALQQADNRDNNSLICNNKNCSNIGSSGIVNNLNGTYCVNNDNGGSINSIKVLRRSNIIIPIDESSRATETPTTSSMGTRSKVNNTV